METIIAAGLNNEALQLDDAGDYAGAERKHLEALRLKIQGNGEHSIQVALTKNGLGELYLKMGELDKAQNMLEGADAIRSEFNDFDAACTRDNIGRLWEMKGDFSRARACRARNPEKMICSSFSCSWSSVNRSFKQSELKACAKCKCAFYCSKECQKDDWKRHRGFCRQPEGQ